MTLTQIPTEGIETADQTPPKHHPYRWRMNRAGLVDVWYYYDTEFDLSGGRLVLRGTNGSGKSRALELLLPFVLDADRRKMDATGSGKVSLVELMKAGAADRTTRAGYVWLELARSVDPTDPADAELHESGTTEQHTTIGAHIRFSRSTGEAKVHYFTTDLRVGYDLELLSPTRETLPRDKLADLIGADRITTSPGTHRDRVRATVFTLTGDAGAERYAGLLQLLHTLRSPDVGNRIEEGRLPQILSDALPPLDERALNAAGEQLDGLSETRLAQGRLEAALGHVNTFFDTYRRYAATAVSDSAENTTKAASAAEAAVKDAKNRATVHAELDKARGENQARMGELDESIADLSGTIAGIKQSSAYADARDLDEREKRVEALGAAAVAALVTAERARGAEGREVRTANEAAAKGVSASERAAAAVEKARTKVDAAGVSGGLPASIAATTAPASVLTEPVRLTRDGDPTPLDRPVPVQLSVTPDDLGSAVEQARLVQVSATERGRQAAGRLDKAQALDVQRGKVEAAERRAEEADQRANEAEEVDLERQVELTTAADTYASQWRDWVSAAATVAAFGAEPDLTGTGIDAVLADAPIVIGDLSEDDLTELDHVAGMLAETVREQHTHTIAELDAADQVDDAVRNNLKVERTQLESAVDPSPTTPTWIRPRGVDAIPLWRAIDFGDDLDATDRAGLEGALLASGLLLADLHRDGTLHAENGQLLLTPTGPVDETPVTGKLIADPGSPMPVEVVEAVLARIGFGDRRSGGATTPAGVWVAPDGSWGSGPLTGRYLQPVARHIGTTARAEARRVRLAAIEVELAQLADAAEVRAAARAEARAARDRLGAVTRNAPRTQAVSSARVRAADATNRAAKERSRAHEAAMQASELRTAWSRDVSEHRAICSEFNLPHTADDLQVVRHATGEAESACRDLSNLLDQLITVVADHADAVGRAGDRTDERVEDELRAATEWTTWHREASELESVRSSIGQEAEAAKAELRECETTRKTLEGELDKARTLDSRLGVEVGTAEAEARAAAERVTTTHEDLAATFDQFRRRLEMPGITAAAFAEPPETIELSEVTPAAVRKAVTRTAAGLRRHSQGADENTLFGPQRTLERDLSGSYDVITEVRDGVRLIELSDATGRRSIADAAAELTRTVEEGRNALSERERSVFTEFVLGGVAEELRRRLDQADELIAAMNASLATIRTSHGIGVKLRWKISESSDPAVVRIKELVSTAGAVRSADQTAELTELLKDRVNEAFELDESAGYATHLHDALDYRSWHTVEVIILGPKSGQERRISRKARLSQGETRFVSYVALFAAIDAYLSGLPDTGRALRLLLLDDAFAKVDNRTIGELMGLLVRLDVDFAMTGHALWGDYPQVPALDCYEVRRVEGSAAVTTHVRWDGHTRHLRAAPR
ncbi:TIGR02680 family protein [Nocardioides sp. LMS-CY]|uniref:TIGR02680 family protein n=1 Tax=Nocardioides sp. (strain LMS-CY) TaxID=2840457 RepID=UPI001C0085A9|nr:TIGR02680 family protein [Nocardioides sp. LMS-CY]QWF24334.1 TIGR02680 family protein [Nocardioides sp. LMS-CY]